MKICKVCILLSALFVFFQSCSLPTDDEAKENGSDFSYELPWSGETDKFSITAEEGIHLNAPAESAGTAYLTIPSTSIRSTRWEFGVHLSFNPSANNYACFYLSSSSNMLSGSLNGYFVQIGGAKDNVGLYRQNGDKPQLLASGRELMKGINSPKIYIKVECDANGYWTFWTRLESETEYTKEKQIKDTQITTSTCCGIYCIYTKSRCDGFTFYHVQVSHDVETSTTPDETPDKPDSPDEPETPDVPSYPTDVRNLLLLNEVMYDNAADGVEYIELYNPSGITVSVPALKLLRYAEDQSGVMHTTQTAILKPSNSNQNMTIPPHGYICFTKSLAILARKHNVDRSTVIEFANFPSINNEGGYLAIVTNEEKARLIDKCSYFDTMHTDKKRKQGVSLEKKSPELASSIRGNWHSSTDTTGGTPGIKNSGEDTNL